MNFTASQIAAALGITPQAVRKHLRDAVPGKKIVNGIEAAAWAVQQLPEPMLTRLEAVPDRKHFRTLEDFLSTPAQRFEPALPLDKICDADIQTATHWREALQPWLIQRRNPALSSAEMETRGVEDYRRISGHSISTRYWREIFARTVQRDRGAEEWNRLEIYLPDRLRQKDVPAEIVSAALHEDFADLENYLSLCSNAHDLNAPERAGLWELAFVKYDSLVRDGYSEKSAARNVRNFLFARAKCVSPTRNALRMAFERKLEDRQRNKPQSPQAGHADHSGSEYPLKDIKRVRHSAAVKNGGRIDAAWREEYPLLSEHTRQLHPCSRRCPAPFYQLVNRVKVDALVARLQGRRPLRQLIGGVKRNADGIPTMARWAVDDMTGNIEVLFTNRDGSFSLIQPQIITVMDFASRKWVGWSIGNVKAPTAELVCAAVLDGFRRHNVPRKLHVENGFVFGKSMNVNGRVDAQGRTVVAGLAQYGCTIHHFEKMSPTSKAELEKSFDLIQRRMERYPGYAGRLQMLDASDDFKQEQRLIRSGRLNVEEAKKFRLTYDEFARVVMPKLIEEYNSEKQYGHLNGLCPNEAFEALKDPNDPPIKFDNRLQWMLTNERYSVVVTAGGVKKTDGGPLYHYGRKIQVRGGELPQHIGEKFWALVDRQDASMVTFMSLDYRTTFTVETCREPSADEPRIVDGTSVLAAELKKISQHARAVEDELKELKAEFGNPRKDLLAEIRNQSPALAGVTDATTRRVILNSRIETSADQMQAQRHAITEKRQQSTANKSRARRQGIPSVLVGDDERTRRALQLRAESRQVQKADTEDGEVTYHLKPSAADQIKYVDYLVKQLVKFRNAGKSFGQVFKGEITFGTVKKIAESQLACSLHDLSRFNDVCAHLKAAIDATILGKNNSSKGVPNYHEFAQPQETP